MAANVSLIQEISALPNFALYESTFTIHTKSTLENMQTEDGKPVRHSRFWKAITFFWLILAAIGAVLPLMPTTVFLLLAAWSAPKASPKLEKWLYEHPKFGPLLCAWRDERAVSMRSKFSALFLMCTSWAFLYYMYGLGFVSLMVGGIFVCVLAYLFWLPVPKQTK